MRFQLFHSPASPYVRKVMVMAHETGQDVELLPSQASPVARDMTIAPHNPTGKVPTAMTPDGPLYDSRVICQWLDAQHDGRRMYPADAPARWITLRREALADGLLDAALLARYEAVMRPEALRWPAWSEGQMAKIDAALDAMEQDSHAFDEVDAGTIATGCALGYLDFRFPDHDWRAGRAALAGWFDRFSQRPSMQETRPTP